MRNFDRAQAGRLASIWSFATQVACVQRTRAVPRPPYSETPGLGSSYARIGPESRAGSAAWTRARVLFPRCARTEAVMVDTVTLWAVDELQDGEMCNTSYEPSEEKAQEHHAHPSPPQSKRQIRRIEIPFGEDGSCRAVALYIRNLDFSPRHVFDLPDPLTGFAEDGWMEVGQIVSREHGLAEVAEFNRDRLGKSDSSVWAVLIQLGAQFDGYSAFEIADGTGCEREYVDRVFRVVQPTPEEREAHCAVAAKGGA